ncbi:hypothetical protein [Treponema sp.]|uniref:hypothetical protein n=1 Tax=Treponema sp. TaxID=166 RepID=UPI00388E09AA
MASIKSFPNNADTYIGAEEVMKWLHGRTSGVFAAAGNAAVAAVATPTMAVTVSDGVGWMSDGNGDGVVWWNDENTITGSLLQLSIDSADGVLNRIDRIIVEWATTNYVDYPEIKVLKGTPGSTAVVPALTNNSSKRQISLAKINVAAGTTAIQPSMITDERLDPSVCGLVTESLTVDTTTMQAQFQAFLTAIEEELNQLNAGTAFEFKRLQFTNTSVAKSAFLSDSTYEDFPYKAQIPLTGVLATMTPEVVFGLADAVSGIYAPIAEAYAGGISIWASDVPESETITIPTIILWKAVN